MRDRQLCKTSISSERTLQTVTIAVMLVDCTKLVYPICQLSSNVMVTCIQLLASASIIYHYDQWCIAKMEVDIRKGALAKGLKVPCLFMITEVSIRCQENPGGWYTAYTRVCPPIHHWLWLMYRLPFELTDSAKLLHFTILGGVRSPLNDATEANHEMCDLCSIRRIYVSYANHEMRPGDSEGNVSGPYSCVKAWESNCLLVIWPVILHVTRPHKRTKDVITRRVFESPNAFGDRAPPRPGCGA